jgi:hypothetical protein
MSGADCSSIYVPYSEKIGTHFFAKNFLKLLYFLSSVFVWGKELRGRGDRKDGMGNNR